MESQAQSESASQAAAVRILVAEDDAMVRFAVAEALRDAGASVIEAANADEAWEYLLAGGAVDLILTDHRMPGSMTGCELAGRVRRQFPAIEIVVTSGELASDRFEKLVTKPYHLARTADYLVRLAGGVK